LHDAPDFAIEPAAHLIAALAPEYPRGSVFLSVVDPGVGGKRDAIVVRADGRTFVGPDNGLLSILWQRARRRKCFRIAWRPKRLTSSFHGRDLFAPIAASLASGKVPRGRLAAKLCPDVLLDPGDLMQVIYVDHYGNCMTGIRASRLSRHARLRAGNRVLRYARTFEDARGAFWHENSLGLAEISMPRGSADRTLGLRIGHAIRIAR
jgi:S-adenosylmethionine hydrolase